MRIRIFDFRFWIFDWYEVVSWGAQRFPMFN